MRLTSAAGGGPLRLDQVSAVYELAGHVQRGEVGLTETAHRLLAILEMRPLFGTLTLGLGVLSAGVALALQPTLLGVVGAFVLGTLVGCALLIWVPELQAVMPVAVSFCVATVVFLLAEHHGGENPNRSLIPPLVIFLPGAASGDLFDRPFDQLGSWTTVLALVVIALGNHLHLCALRRAVPWILLVWVAASAGQEFGAAVFSLELSAFFGALVMTPLVLLIGRRRAGPPSMVLFLPVF